MVTSIQERCDPRPEKAPDRGSDELILQLSQAIKTVFTRRSGLRVRRGWNGAEGCPRAENGGCPFKCPISCPTQRHLVVVHNRGQELQREAAGVKLDIVDAHPGPTTIGAVVDALQGDD